MCTHITLTCVTLLLIRVSLTLLWKLRHLDVYMRNFTTGPRMIGQMCSPRHIEAFGFRVMAIRKRFNLNVSVLYVHCYIQTWKSLTQIFELSF